MNTSIEPSPREEEGGVVKQPLEVHREEPSPTRPDQGIHNCGAEELLMTIAVQDDSIQVMPVTPAPEALPLPSMSRSFACTKRVFDEAATGYLPARAMSAPGLEQEAQVQAAPKLKLTREEALRKLDMVPRQRGTRPLFSAAELVPFFEEPAPRLTPLLEEGCGVDTEADPWDLFFLEENDDGDAFGHPTFGNAFRSAFGSSSAKRGGCLPWLVQLSPPPSRCMSPSRESTCVPEESLPKSAWTSDEDGREF